MSASSSVGSRSHNRQRPRQNRPQRTHCDCGDPVGKWTGWREGNPGRRFIGCPNYRDPQRDCRFFDWVDPELPNDWYKELLFDLHNGQSVDAPVHNVPVHSHVQAELQEVVPVPVKSDEGRFVAAGWKTVVYLCVFVAVIYMFM